MRRVALYAVLIASLVLLTQACAHHSTTFETASFDPEKYVRKVDQFVIIADGSVSMGDRSGGERKLDISGAFLEALNQSIPELGYEGEVRTFGRGSCDEKGKTVVLSSLDDFSVEAVAKALESYNCAGGGSPLNLALSASGDDLTRQNIPTAVVIVSDGRHMNTKEVEAASALKNAFGKNLEIYAVQIGNDRKGTALLEEVVTTGGAGYVKPGMALTSATEMQQFVTDVFLYPDDDGDGVPNHLDKCPGTPKGVKVDKHGCPLDDDGDGVPNYLDKCPGTPKGVKVDKNGCPLDDDGDGVPNYLDKCPNTPKGAPVDSDGCPLDSDGDGVPDYLDKCPGTPRGVPVNKQGCPVEGIELVGDEWMVRGRVLFDTNKATIKKEAASVLKNVANYLKKNRQWVIEIQGNTDNTGSLAWNMELSEKRAQSVKDFLVENGVAAARLTTKGFGPNEPIAANDTEEGRAMNRRVDFRPTEK